MFLVVLFMLPCETNALSDSERINWFFKSKGDNTRPKILEGCNIDLGNSLYIGNEGDKRVYLTFDAGYSNENLESILDSLKKHNANAAFFILPGIIKNSPDVVKRMARDGHLVCNHTTSHCDMSRLTNIDSFEKEMRGIEEQYRALTGMDLEKYIRPPEGAFSVKCLEFCEQLGYTPVFWSFAYADWDNGKQPDTEKAKAKIFNNIHDGMVLLLHPTSRTNALIMDDLLTELSARGYSFGTLDELAEQQTR